MNYIQTSKRNTIIAGNGPETTMERTLATLAFPYKRTFTRVTGRDPLPPQEVTGEVNVRALHETEACIARAPPNSTIEAMSS